MTDRDQLVVTALGNTQPASSGWARVNCPFCLLKLGKVDRKRALGVFVASGTYHCFRCGTKGKVYGGLDAFKDFTPPEQEVVKAEPPAGYVPLYEEPGKSALSAEDARRYLRGRGLSEPLWKEAKIGACLSGANQGRVVVPVLANDGETWLGWVSRVWVKKAERAYLNMPGAWRQGVLYNHAALFTETEEPVLVVEGVFDALALWPQAVAVLGKPSEPQVAELVASRRPVAIVLDGDAWEEAEMLAMRLRFEGQRAGFVKLAPRIDPDEVPRGWLDEEVRRCFS